MSAQLHDISTVSRLDLDMKAYTHATARLKAAEQEQLMAFREYHEARQRLIDNHGVTSDVELGAGLAAAYSVFKQDKARAEGREIAKVLT